MSECGYCGAETDCVLEPPIVRIPRSELHGYDDGDERVLWHAPTQACPGGDWYNVLREDDQAIYVRPWECADEPICIRCWDGCIIPALVPYLCNKPPQLRLNGWRDAEWVELSRKERVK